MKLTNCISTIFITALSLHAADTLDYAVSWVGNSFSGPEGWVLHNVKDICVANDGTVFTNVFWDEAGGNQTEFKEGRFINYARWSHGWGKQGGDAVCANEKFLFFTQRWDNEGGHLHEKFGIKNFPPPGYHWWGVSRRNRSDIQTAVPFDGGRGGKEAPEGSFKVVLELPTDQNGTLGGVCASETELFVACPYDDSVRVYDTETMALKRTWPAHDPLDLCLDTAGNLWVIAGYDRNAVHSYTPEGVKREIEASLPEDAVAADICIDAGNRLYIGDGGSSNQVLIFDGLEGTPSLVDRFGKPGGIRADTRGKIGERKFNHIAGVGVDTSGNIYVASASNLTNTIIESYTAEGALNWRVLGLQFVDVPGIDPGDATHVYTMHNHYVLDYSRESGNEWKYEGHTIDREAFPDDPRLHIGGTNAWIRRIQGKRILLVTSMVSQAIHAYRFTPETMGEIALPAAMFSSKHITRDDNWPPHQPAEHEWMWCDNNGNGAFDDGEYQAGARKISSPHGGVIPDMDGNLWQTFKDTIRCLPMLGLDSHGNTMWDLDSACYFPFPDEFDLVRRMYYLPQSDVMILGGNRGDHKNQHWKPMGPVLACYDTFTSGSPSLRWDIVLPYETGSSGHTSHEPMSLAVAGDYLFVGYTRGLGEENLSQAFVKVYRLDNAECVGNLTHEDVLGKTGLLDCVESVAAHRRDNGEYVVLLEDDWKSKSVMYRWCPGGNCRETTSAGRSPENESPVLADAPATIGTKDKQLVVHVPRNSRMRATITLTDSRDRTRYRRSGNLTGHWLIPLKGIPRGVYFFKAHCNAVVTTGRIVLD